MPQLLSPSDIMLASPTPFLSLATSTAMQNTRLKRSRSADTSASPGPSCVRLSDTEHPTYGSNRGQKLAPLRLEIPEDASRDQLENGAEGNNGDADPNTERLEERVGRENGWMEKIPLIWSPRDPLYLTLENSGSVARDHLASERTFLSYVRTSLAIASAGVALVQLFDMSLSSPDTPHRIKSHLQRFARPLGATVVIIGILVLFIGIGRYFRIQSALIAGKFPPARHVIIFISGVLAILVSSVFGILVGITH